jgi:hypothetical protein
LYSFNRYAYAVNSPTTYRDPMGLWSWKSFAIAAGEAVAGAVVGAGLLVAAGSSIPFIAVAATATLVVGAAYGGYQLGIQAQIALTGNDPWTGKRASDKAYSAAWGTVAGAAVGGPVAKGAYNYFSGLGAAAAGAGGAPAAVTGAICQSGVALDTNPLIQGLDFGQLPRVQTAMRGRYPIVSRMAAREYMADPTTRPETSQRLRNFLTQEGGRLGAVPSADQIGNLQQIAQSDNPPRVLHTPDARVAASAIIEGVPVITNDGPLVRFLTWLGYPFENW